MGLVRLPEQKATFHTKFPGANQRMDINKMLADLRAEREQIEEAIMTLERLARGRGKRRGRPPAWMSNIKRRGRPPGSKNRPKSETKASAKAAVA
jgi:DNA invertase Pin-like site-specific DNA recombinase